MKEIIISSEKHGIKKVLVDDEDFEFLNKWKWCLFKMRNTFYVHRIEYGKNGEKDKSILMHRLIMGYPNCLVDHVDRNTLNNQRSNLRQCTYSQNTSNTEKINKACTSKYKGVHMKKGKWVAKLKKNQKGVHIGTFTNEVDAAIAYNKAAIIYHGEFARLNKIAIEESVNNF